MFKLLRTNIYQRVSIYSLGNQTSLRYIAICRQPRIVASSSYLQSPNYNLIFCRNKRGIRKPTEDLESDDEEDVQDDFENQLTDKSTRIMNCKVNSLRADVILKAGLGMARSKIEESFYQSKIRLNGQKIFKKSEGMHEGDEVDIIKGTNVNNPVFLTVARVELLAAVPKAELYAVKLRRCKSLIVENYADPWKPD